ncbi:hypothetical protein L6164_008408 [Bauhinia variegata]|uniref:Uncharacterized protein n=1 Tax=Bauhinia variegata TaxID=167791 RepID=A0ACB9PGE0_BAUVA|nr:hypothetical protein L6164_008408 [Bauhinia variegata]
MDALNFLKFWKHASMAAAASSTTVPNLEVEMDNGSDEEDSFFDLELSVDDPEEKTVSGSNVVETKQEGPRKIAVSETAPCVCSSEPISKRKILPIEPVSKPQSPIAMLKSAPSFRIFMPKKPKATAEKAESDIVAQKQQKKKEFKVFALKLNLDESCDSPSLSRVNSSASCRSKLQNLASENSKSEKFSKDILQKYLNLIRPLYVKLSKRNSEKVKFSEELMLSSASPSSPSVPSVSSQRREKQGNVSAGIRIVGKHLGKSRSASAATGVASPASRSDDTLLEQHDGIQSAILHCKRSLNSRDSSSTNLVRKSFEEENGGTV